MKVIGRIGCLFGWHKRSRSRVSHHAMHPASVCRYCATPMVKINGAWRSGVADAVPMIGALER